MTEPPIDTDKRLEAIHPRLEEFVCSKPVLKANGIAKVNATAEALREIQEEMLKYQPKPDDLSLKRIFIDEPDSEDQSHEENKENDITEPISQDIIATTPPIAPNKLDFTSPNTAEFHRLMRNQLKERQKLSEDFKKEESQLQTLFYDAKIRDNSQRNELQNKRPMSEALRYISKKIAYPAENANPRFYKYNFRIDKYATKHQKLLDKMEKRHDYFAECMLQSQVQKIIVYGDINHEKVSEVAVPKLPTGFNQDY